MGAVTPITRLSDAVAADRFHNLPRFKPQERSAPLAPQSAPALDSVQAVTLTASELQLVGAFLERRASFAPDVRSSMARQVAETLGRRWLIPEEDWKNFEKFLESLAEQSRNITRVR
jgi:hypothetical protein